MFPDVAPAVEEEVPVGLELGELYAVVRLEAVPEVRAAVAHELHLPLVFVVARGELDPVVGQREPLDDPVVAARPVVGERRPGLDPGGQAFGDHRLRGRPELGGVKVAEAAARRIEGDFHVRVLGYPAGVGGPYPVDEAGRPRRCEAHLVDPDAPRKLRRVRPFRGRVEASVDPELGRLLVDPGDLGDHPVGAVHRYQGQYRPYPPRRQLRG